MHLYKNKNLGQVKIILSETRLIYYDVTANLVDSG